MKMRRGAALGALALSVVGMVAAYRLGRARADGVPMVNPLYYGGMLDDAGRPVEGTRNVTVRLWDAASAGATVCTTNAGATAFSGGRFRVALDSGCVGAVRANPELWAELQVEGTVFPRAKLGAVPYALEAGRATGAAGALEARLAAVETRPSRQVVIGAFRPSVSGGDPFSQACPTPVIDSWVPLRSPSVSLTFAASVTGYYQVHRSVSSVAANDCCGNRYSVRAVFSPPVPPPQTLAGRELYRLEGGQTYTVTHEIHVLSTPPCVGPMTGQIDAPIIVEQWF